MDQLKSKKLNVVDQIKDEFKDLNPVEKAYVAAVRIAQLSKFLKNVSFEAQDFIRDSYISNPDFNLEDQLKAISLVKSSCKLYSIADDVRDQTETLLCSSSRQWPTK